MFGFNFGFEDIMEDCILEIKLGNQIQKQRMSAPREIIEQQFIGLMQETAQNQQPIKIKLIKQEEIWNQRLNQNKLLDNYIQFANKRYMEAFPEEFKEE